MTIEAGKVIGVVGGTGHLGAALARRWAKAGYGIVIGSRDADKARVAADALGAEQGRSIASGTNKAAAERADIVVVTVPFASQAAVLDEIRPVVAGKIVVDTTVPLVPPKVMRVQLPAEGCAAARAQALLGADVRVVSAFHNVAAHKLATDELVECDVLVFGDDKAARAEVVALADAAGLRGLHAGALANSAAAEALTSILIFMNRNYAVDGAGIRITGELNAIAD
ncbi:NADPH-dependent F420 reductase [Aromatoleum anaerobium]|uniref:NADPH-dependent F420 reductase n=1 Tax=Aromatoleum anaerobium TaxID=182180 RepID=A0ABX1PNW5_9RHOO|nr:NADPH-dependent F420 reductase [Aromatoleum anaerobium]MCK0508178.1 NADPH-dependent F420 reductase [Aromatoleum anaerobium]